MKYIYLDINFGIINICNHVQGRLHAKNKKLEERGH